MEELAPVRTIDDALEPYLAVDRTPRRSACWVTGHMVAGLDGTAAVGGRVRALSTSADQVLFRRMRQLADVVLVGAETVRREGYGAVRLEPSAREARARAGMPPLPPVAIVSGSFDLDWAAPVFRDAGDGARTLVIGCERTDAGRRRAAEQVADVIVAGRERVEPAAALAALAGRGHRTVLCEGGPTWLGEIVAAGLLDELFLSISPVMGGDPLPVAITPDGSRLVEFEMRHTLAEEGTLFLRYEAKADPHV